MKRILVLNDLFLAGTRKKITSHEHTVGGIHHVFIFQYIITEKHSCRLEPTAKASYRCLYIAEMIAKTLKSMKSSIQ